MISSSGTRTARNSRPGRAEAALPKPDAAVCTFTVGGVRCQLAHLHGAWRAANLDEIRMLAALGEETQAIAMTNTVSRLLDHGVIRTCDAQLIVRRLEWILNTEFSMAEYPPPDCGLQRAELFACALSDDAVLQRHLGSVLLWRLVPNSANGSLWVDSGGEVRWGALPYGPFCGREAAGLLADMPASFWTMLRRHPNRTLRDMATVTNPETMPMRLWRFVNDDRPEVLIALALHPQATSLLHRAMLRRSADLDGVVSRCMASAIACNKSASRRLLDVLLGFSGETRMFATLHPRFPEWKLGWEMPRAVADGDRMTLIAIAANPRTPTQYLRVLAAFHDTAVVSVVAGNRGADGDILRPMLKHPHRSVRAACIRNPRLGKWDAADCADDRATQVRAALANRPDTYPHVLLKLSADASEWVRSSVAGNPASPADLLRRLALDGHGAVRRAVAFNPRTPSDVLEHLAGDSSPYVRGHAASNHGTPAAVLAELARESPAIRCSVASNPSAGSETLRQLAADDHWMVRESVASNPSAPMTELRRLTCDSAVGVRHAASRRLRNPAT